MRSGQLWNGARPCRVNAALRLLLILFESRAQQSIIETANAGFFHAWDTMDGESA